MKKIMFNDRYGLTEAVLEGRKTMTRRIIPNVIVTQALNEIDEDGDIGGADTRIIIDRFSRYKVGEVVAVAQSYKDAGILYDERTDEILEGCAGWTNKMFVTGYNMPHQIRITNVRVERLQDISDEDCLREGIYAHTVQLDETPGVKPYTSYSYNMLLGSNIKRWWFDTPRKAFAALIDKLNGKGTWDSNPWVFVYEFELVK